MLKAFRSQATMLGEVMTFRVFVPDSYEYTTKRYPVLYMQDGQNVFLDNDSVDGQSYNFIDYYNQYKQFLPEVIIVGIDCPMSNDERTALYIPYSHDWSKVPSEVGYKGTIKGRCDDYLLWIIQNLKPWMDTQYRTIPDARYTALGGDSSAGVTSLYGVVKYSQYFQRFIALSGAFAIWFDLLSYDMDHSDFSLEYAYIDVGGQDVGRITSNNQFVTGVPLLKNYLERFGYGSTQVKCCFFPHDEHTNECFGRRFPDALRWIFQDCK